MNPRTRMWEHGVLDKLACQFPYRTPWQLKYLQPGDLIHLYIKMATRKVRMVETLKKQLGKENNYI